MVLNIPKGYDGKKYTLTMTNINKQTVNVNFTQTAAATPTVVRTSAASVAPGVNEITLNRTILASVVPETIQLFSTSNPSSVITVSSPTYVDPLISFNVTVKSGQYGFKLYDSLYGWYTSASTIDVSQTGSYTLAAFQTSFNGGQVTITGADIGEGATVTVNGQVGTYLSGTVSDAIFSIPKLITPLTQTTFNLAKNKSIDLSSKVMWGDSNGWEYAFDSDHATKYASNNTDCSVGVDFGANSGIFLTRIRYFPNSAWAVASDYIKGGKF